MIHQINTVINNNGIESAYSCIQEAIARGDFQTRMDIALLLCEYNCSFSEELLMFLLDDACVYVKIEAVDALAILRTEKAYCKIRNLCFSKNHLLRGHSIMAIGRTTPLDRTNETVDFLKNILNTENSAFVKICICFSLYLLGEESQLMFLKQKYNRCGYRNKCFILNGLADLLYDGQIKDLSVVNEIIDIAQHQNDGRAVLESLCLLKEASKHLN